MVHYHCCKISIPPCSPRPNTQSHILWTMSLPKPKLRFRISQLVLPEWNHSGCFLLDFHRSNTIMHWTTGSTLFEKFPMHLQATYVDTWTIAAKQFATQKSQTIVNFHVCIHALKTGLDSSTIPTLVTSTFYALRKPVDIDPSSMFHTYLPVRKSSIPMLDWTTR
jgi:hypothetical protein